MVYSPKQDGGKTCQKTKIGTGSTSTGTVFLVSENHTGDVHVSADSRGSPAVKSNADKGEHNSHGSIEIISEELTSKDLKDFLRLGKNAYLHLDGTTTKESISVGIDLKSVSPTVIEGETCENTESNQDDGSTASKTTTTDSGWADSESSQEGKVQTTGEAFQSTDVQSLGSESNTHQDDGSTAPVLSTTADGIVNEAISKDWEVQQSSMESLPADIVQDILSRVPAEFVLGCKLVCKKWVTLIRGNNFANMHLTRQLKHLHDGDDGDDNLAAKVEPCLFFACRIDDPDEFISLLFHGGQVSDKISNDEKYIYNENLKRIYHPPMHNKPLSYHLVGSCNGLVCAFQHHHLMLDPIYICNPLTREYVYLPELVVNKEDVDPDLIDKLEGEVNMYGRVACGFGYVSSTNEYKVVRIHYLDTYVEGNVEVYTLGSGCGWRAIGRVSYGLSTVNGGTYANDAIYWVSYNKVAAFDLAKEEFRLVSSVPPCLQNRQNEDTCGLVAMGSHVCFYMDKLRLEMWSLTRNSNSEETWRFEFDIDYEAAVGSRGRNIQPILLAKNGVIIFLHAKSVLYCYDMKTKVLKMISNDASTDYFEAVEAIAHTNTFVSLEAMGEKSKRHTVRTPLDDDVIDELDSLALGENLDTTQFRLR